MSYQPDSIGVYDTAEYRDPNNFLNGFFPAWPMIMLGLAGEYSIQNR
jgi:hypothetical protein